MSLSQPRLSLSVSSAVRELYHTLGTAVFSLILSLLQKCQGQQSDEVTRESLTNTSSLLQLIVRELHLLIELHQTKSLHERYL